MWVRTNNSMFVPVLLISLSLCLSVSLSISLCLALFVDLETWIRFGSKHGLKHFSYQYQVSR